MSQVCDRVPFACLTSKFKGICFQFSDIFPVYQTAMSCLVSVAGSNSY